MAAYTLNIYGEDDEILKTYETDHVRWKIFLKACELQDEIAKESVKDQLAALSGFMQSVFPGLTEEEVEQADAFDIFAIFRMIVGQAGKINGFDSADAEKNV